MSVDLDALREAVAQRGRVARVVILETAGSVPREAGASMLVWAEGQSGTIGGGRLEYEAARVARAALGGAPAGLARVPLGTALGQCCGGAVKLLTEVFDAASLSGMEARRQQGCLVRPVAGGADEPPLKLTRLLARLRNGAEPLRTRLVDGWAIEPIRQPRHDLRVYGAGHVGRAIVSLMAPLEDWRLTWIDTHAERFPADPPANIALRVAEDPAGSVAEAPPDAHHLILTYSHALDFALCHALLTHGFASAGLIGSATKWARFRKRLGQLGHSDASILRIACPIGDPSLGKHPQAIAIGVTGLLLKSRASRLPAAMDRPA
ncbi:xanthine dehydrogenase accessory protein XdhC [Tropicimonas sp. IMCC6043]|uniref:xanthine dehydrogenase accessory protein XdhC n=1 Tax=Tropicimonas sp. IMCC6043 TaxID=2510645 RepID=UPI00101C3417|nr:xanthine dehydrogenase accessory protein XdhC [Tropicimonas sp. IMCC6043]RYH06856.1 xanthine dehydrogenase accessory protein XdhC [Tropicimonas sp. IMCC6043]